jgi:hypothetical protein
MTLCKRGASLSSARSVHTVKHAQFVRLVGLAFSETPLIRQLVARILLKVLLAPSATEASAQTSVLILSALTALASAPDQAIKHLGTRYGCARASASALPASRAALPANARAQRPAVVPTLAAPSAPGQRDCQHGPRRCRAEGRDSGVLRLFSFDCALAQPPAPRALWQILSEALKGLRATDGSSMDTET